MNVFEIKNNTGTAIYVRPGNGWIAVDEALPRNAALMLIAYRAGVHVRPDGTIRRRPWQITVARHSGGKWRFVIPSQKSRLSNRVKFWQPIPDAPATE